MHRRIGHTVIFGVLLACVLCAQAPEATADKDFARQTAAAANDNANTFEARQEALKALQHAAGLFIETGETVEAARTLNRVGRLQVKLNSPQAALETYNKALSLLKSAPATEVEIDSLNGMAAAHLVLKEMDQVAETLKRSLILCAQSGYILGQAQALLTLSELQNYDNHVVALDTAQKALALWLTVNDKAGLARCYSQVARCLMAQNRLPEATQTYETALQLWRDLNDQPEQAGVLIMLGFIEQRKGEWQSAITYFIEAQRLVDEKAEPRRMGQISAGLGDSFNENGLPENGLVHFQSALAYYRLTQDPRSVRSATLKLGRTYYLLKDYPIALIHFQEVLKGVDPDGLDATTSYEYFGRIYGETGDYSTALQYFQKALVILDRSVNPREAAQMRALIGQIYQQQTQLDRAREYYRQALTTFATLTDRIDQAAVHYALGRLELKAGNLDAAEDHLRKSIEVTENMRRVSTSSDLTAAFSATVHERYQSYIECLMRKHETQPGQDLAIRAFEMSELARGRSLLDLLSATQTTLVPGLDAQLAVREKSLRQSLRVKEDSRIKLLGTAYKREELATMEGELAQLEAEYRQVTEIIRERFPAYEQITTPTALSLRQIQEQVVRDDQTVLLEYSLGADRSYVWAVTRNDIKSYELPAQAQINEAAQKVYELLTTTDPAKSGYELSQATRELGRMVLSPVAAELNKSRIIVVADGALHYIPFQILPASSASDQPLVAATEVINAPSASILGQLREETARRQAPTKVLAAFGDPVFESNYSQRKATSSGEYVAAVQPVEGERWQRALRDIEPVGDSVDPSKLEPLFYTKYELANLRDVAGAESLMVTSFDATREKLASLDLTKYAILHFATHGVLDPKRPENSGLFLSMVNSQGQEQNGFVGLQDIYSLHAPVELVVLSACRTGLGKDVRGEGLIGLTRGFMYAGASSVVASLWKVDDEATAELMKQFYGNMLQRGMTPASALREAQNNIRQQPQWRSPYYWAAFTLQGESNRVIKIAPVRWMSGRQQIALGLSILLLFALSGWYLRSRGKGKRWR